MKIYKKLLTILILAFVILYPILPSYGLLSSDSILFLLLLIQVTAFIFLPAERKSIINVFKNLKKDKIFLSLIILNIVMYLSTIVAVYLEITIKGSIRFSMFVFIYYNIAYNLKGKKEFNALLASFIGIALLSSIFSIYQLIQNLFYNTGVNEEHRIASFLENSNNLGAYSIFAIFIVIMLLINAKNKSQKIFLSICSILLILNIILSQSRNALLALVLGLFLLSLIYNKKLIIPSFLIAILLLLIPESQKRLMSILDFSQNSSRIKIWETTYFMIHDKPLWGIGYDNYYKIYPSYIKYTPRLMIHESYEALHPHNVLLKFHTELGILGTIAFMLFIILTITNIYKNIKRSNDTKMKSIYIAIIVAFISFLFMNMIDCFYNSLKVMITMFIVLGMANYHLNNNVKKFN